MPELSVQFIVLLVGLFLVLYLLLSRRLDLDGCLAAFLALVLIFVAFFVFYILDPVKIYQCQYEIPDQINVAGHIRDDSNPQPNGYLVILLKGDKEIGRFLTRHGSFAIDEKDEPRDGYFELSVPNEFQLTRCSMVENFKQNDDGIDVLWLDNEITYLWHNFASIEAGTYPLNNGEPGQVYTLIVLPGDKDLFPIEMSLYSTYLDRNGEVAINAPIKTYRILNLPEANPSRYYIYANPLSDLALGLSTPSGLEVRDAWVADGTTYQAPGSSHLAPTLIDRDNCTGSWPPKDSVPLPLTYMQEVQFQESASLNFDLGVAALKAAPSLGFTQGQMKTIVANIEVDVPVGTHRKYKVHWKDLWITGSMKIDFGTSNTSVPFRARIGMDWVPEVFHVDCPQS